MSDWAFPKLMSSLKRQATTNAKRRGHKLKRLMPLHSYSAVADCSNPNCHASVYVRTKPNPNEAYVSGLAVAVNCGSPDCTYKAKHVAPQYGEEA